MQKIEEKKAKKGVIIGIIIIIIFALAIAIWFLFFMEPNKLTPDYALPEVEANAQIIEGDDSDKMESPDGGGAASLLYSKTVRVSLSQSTASLLVGNPKKSTQDVVFQVVIDDVIIAQSGRLIPGYQVKQVSLDKKAKDLLKNGGYDGTIRILYYDESTGEKAMLNTEIPVKIEVNN